MAKKITKNSSNSELLEVYRLMLVLRRFEEKAGQLYGMGLIGGFCHLYIGQEAVAAGLKYAINEHDLVITSYRAHGLMIALGGNPDAVMAELLGREGGSSKGKGGSMHIFDKEHNFYGGHGIVGAQVSLGTGMAFALNYKEKQRMKKSRKATESADVEKGDKGNMSVKNQDKERRISVALFGDGAANQGQVYESFNMAKLWNLPVLYVIENNEYSMGTSVARGCATSDLYLRGKSFDIDAKQVNGMNFFDAYEGFQDAVEYVRKGNGPFLLELKTYRYRGHSMSDPAKYRTKEELEKYKNSDCVKDFESFLLKEKGLDEAEIKKVKNEVKAIVAQSQEFAESSKEPSIDELYKDIVL